MTWIVKATGGYEYACNREADIFGPDLSDAYRYKDRAEAALVATVLNREMSDGLPYRVVRLRRAGDPIRAELAALRKLADGVRDLRDGVPGIYPTDLFNLYNALPSVQAALLSVSREQSEKKA